MTSMVDYICFHISCFRWIIGTTWKTHTFPFGRGISPKFVQMFLSFSSLTKTIIYVTYSDPTPLPLSTGDFHRIPQPILSARRSCCRPRFLDCLRLGIGGWRGVVIPLMVDEKSNRLESVEAVGSLCVEIPWFTTGLFHIPGYDCRISTIF